MWDLLHSIDEPLISATQESLTKLAWCVHLVVILGKKKKKKKLRGGEGKKKEEEEQPYTKKFFWLFQYH